MFRAHFDGRNKAALADDLLWFIWDNAITSDGQKLSVAWRNQALRPGIRGAAADRDLDAMMQLFVVKAAKKTAVPGEKTSLSKREI